tara:strand:- start:165 stop:458 length:294 start_codon:yes stop_codon:yes gene_type:complete
MAIIKIVKDGVENRIIGQLDWAKSAYPDHTCEVVDEPISENQTTEEQAREWRNSELERTDSLFGLTDHPDHSKIVDYRKALRDWPSTSDFPDTLPTL